MGSNSRTVLARSLSCILPCMYTKENHKGTGMCSSGIELTWQVQRAEIYEKMLITRPSSQAIMCHLWARPIGHQELAATIKGMEGSEKTLKQPGTRKSVIKMWKRIKNRPIYDFSITTKRETRKTYLIKLARHRNNKSHISFLFECY